MLSLMSANMFYSVNMVIYDSKLITNTVLKVIII